MSVLVIDAATVRRLLPMGTCIGLMEQALGALGRGEALNPLRQALRLPGGRGILGLMPGAMREPATFGLKCVSVFPGNHGTPLDSHQGLVMLFEPEHGRPVALVDAGEITAIRTAAVSAVATRLLAREDASDLAILGSGTQARTHLEAMLEVRPVRRVRVWSPNAERRAAFVRLAGSGRAVTVESAASAREAVEAADLVCTTTSSPVPVLEGAWLAPGCHINAVGSSIASARELDTAAVVRSRLFVDRRESTLNEAGDFLFPQREGAIGEDHIRGEIGEILLGTLAGRQDDDEITLFKSLGLAVEDLAAAHHVVREAQRSGDGTPVDLNGSE